jgi:hypothetical protein
MLRLKNSQGMTDRATVHSSADGILLATIRTACGEAPSNCSLTSGSVGGLSQCIHDWDNSL